MNINALESLDKELDCINSFLLSLMNKCNQSETDIVLMALAEEWIRLAKNVIVLLKSKNNTGYVCLIREMFEIILYISYIIQENSDFRALCYLYFTFVNELKYAKMKLSTTDEYKNLMKIAPEVSFLADESDKKRIISRIDEIQKELDKHRFAEVRRYVSKKNKYWYTVNNNIHNLRGLAESINMEGQYVVLYSIFSCYAHGNRALRSFFGSDSVINYMSHKSLLLRIMEYYAKRIDIKDDIQLYLLNTGVIKFANTI